MRKHKTKINFHKVIGPVIFVFFLIQFNYQTSAQKTRELNREKSSTQIEQRIAL